MAYNFKTEEEVKQFLENIGTEYRFSCFSEKNAEGCHLLGDYLETVKKEFEVAAKLYMNNCDELNYDKSCLKFGNYKYLGKGVEQDFMTAFKYFKKSCELGSTSGCLQTGVMLTTNSDEKVKNLIEKDFIEGIKYLEKSCFSGSATACFYASGIYLKGFEGVPKDKKKAADLSLRACDGGNIFACMNLSQMYRNGDGVDKDEKRADEFKKRAREIREDARKKRSIDLQMYT